MATLDTRTPQERQVARVAADLDTLVFLAADLGETKNEAEKLQKEYASEIRSRLTAMGLCTGQAYVRPDGLSATLQTKDTTTYNIAGMIADGLDPAIIQKHTTTEPSAVFVVVRRPKKGKGDDDAAA